MERTRRQASQDRHGLNVSVQRLAARGLAVAALSTALTRFACELPRG
jgi:hypothetical protein